MLGGTAGVCIEEWIAEDVNVPSRCSVAQLVCVLRGGLLRMSMHHPVARCTAGVCIEEWIAEDVNVPSSCSVYSWCVY